MIKRSMVLVSMVLFGSTAVAQPKAAPPAPTPKPAAQVAPPAGADKKLPAPAPQPVPPAPPVAPKPPAPTQEMIDLGKAMAGTWRCTGKVDMGGTQVEVKATMTHKVDANLNKFWVVSTFVGTWVKMKVPPMKFTMFTGYDANTKKLFRVSANSMGGHQTSTATYDAKKVVFEGESSGMNGIVKVRHTEEMISPKEVKVTAEVSKDNGKTFTGELDATCKK